MEELGFFKRPDVGGFSDEVMKKALSEAIENMAKPIEKFNRVGYMQTVPNSHRFTLYGLKISLDNLLDNAHDEEYVREKVKYILTGIANSISAGEEILKKP